MKRIALITLLLFPLLGCSTQEEIVQGQGQSSTDRTAIRIVGFGMGGWVISVKGLDVDSQRQQQEIQKRDASLRPEEDSIQLADW